MKLSLIDADGAEVIPPLDAEVELVVKEPALEGRVNIILNFNNLPLPRYGQYAFHLVVQGLEMAQAPFSVIDSAATS